MFINSAFLFPLVLAKLIDLAKSNLRDFSLHVI